MPGNYTNNSNKNSNSIQFNSTLYLKVLTQQLQEPITKSAQVYNKCTENNT